MLTIILWILLILLGIVVLPVGVWLIIMSIQHGNKLSVTKLWFSWLSRLLRKKIE